MQTIPGVFFSRDSISEFPLEQYKTAAFDVRTRVTQLTSPTADVDIISRAAKKILAAEIQVSLSDSIPIWLYSFRMVSFRDSPRELKETICFTLNSCFFLSAKLNLVFRLLYVSRWVLPTLLKRFFFLGMGHIQHGYTRKLVLILRNLKKNKYVYLRIFLHELFFSFTGSNWIWFLLGLGLR